MQRANSRLQHCAGEALEFASQMATDSSQSGPLDQARLWQEIREELAAVGARVGLRVTL